MKPLVTKLDVAPPILTPNGDGIDDLATVTYTLAAAGQVTATLTNVFGAVVTVPFTGRQTVGKQSFQLDPAGILPGDYTLSVSLRADDGRTATASTGVSIL